MTDQLSETFYSLDEFYSFVTFKTIEDPPNPNDKSVSMIEQSDPINQEKSLSLENDINVGVLSFSVSNAKSKQLIFKFFRRI